MKIVILAHDFFTGQGGKTARGVYLYSGHDIIGILDRSMPAADARDLFPQGRSVRIYSHLDQVEEDYDALIIGISPIGGEISESWYEEIKTALKKGRDVINGLHTFLSEDKGLLGINDNARIIDLRKPDENSYRVLDGSARDARTVLVAGTDCSSGKMVTCIELNKALRRIGINSGFIATGQTGLLCQCDGGSVIDRLPGDFMAGVMEGWVNKVKETRDLILIEGQGSLHHPAYSGVATAILHGSYAKRIILCHNPSRTEHHDFPGFKIPMLRDLVNTIEELSYPVSKGKVAGFSIVGEGMTDDELSDYLRKLEDDFSLPATDVWRTGSERLLNYIL